MHTKEDFEIIKIAVCDSSRMGTQLLAEVLARNECFSVVQIFEPDEIVSADVDTALIGAEIDGEPTKGCDLARRFRAAHPDAQVIVIIEKVARNSVLEIFRSGAKGIFSRTGALSALSKCIKAVHAGHIWASNEEVQYLLDTISEPLKLKLVDTKGKLLLSNREQELARWVVEGLSNREIAIRMNLSEHTVKNYLFRIFDKLGISNRVELIIYAIGQLGPTSSSALQFSQLTPCSSANKANWCPKETSECPMAPLAMGEMYNMGQRVQRDNETALMWLEIAAHLASRVVDRCDTARAALRLEMSTAKIQRAESRAAEWIQTNANDKSSRRAPSSSAGSARASRSFPSGDRTEAVRSDPALIRRAAPTSS